MAKKAKSKSMLEVTAGYEKFIKDREVKADGKLDFNSAIKKSIKRPRASR